MVDIIIKVLEPADSYSLMTVDEAKLLLSITDSSSDATLEMQIATYSDVIAAMCNRVFAKERLTETWRCLQSNRVFLSHYPIAYESDIESVECPRGTVMDPSGYEIELSSGKIELFQTQTEPISVTYTGGYELPDEAPPALKQALTLTLREERRHAQIASVAGMRSLAHKESRVNFFDPNAAIAKLGASGSAVPEPVKNLLMHYIRIQV